MKKSSLLFFLLAIAISFSANAQVLDSLYCNDHLKINSRSNTYLMSHLVNNLDNDTTDWVCTDSVVFYGIDGVSKAGYTLNFNSNNLEILDSIHGYAFQYKYNNKLYYVDSKFICCNLNRDGSIIQTNIFNYLEGTSFTYSNIKNIFSKEKEFYLFYNTLESPYEKTYIYVVDTLGNILRSDSIQRRVESFEIIEQGNNILFSDYFGSPYSSQSQLYLIDKQSLKIVDSISNINYISGSIATINDSIIIAESIDMSSNRIYKVNTKTHNENILINRTVPQGLQWCSLSYSHNRRIDYINKDSIYLCFLTELPRFTGYYPDTLVRICIANFNISGVLNYTYLVDFNIEEHQKIIGGVKATDDGGLLMAVSSRRYWPASQLTELWTNYIIKFMPNGYSSITNVQTGEKESIRVYPNPAKDYVNVDIECINFKASNIQLFDMQGRIVKTAKLKAKQGNRIDVSSLNAGAYTYNVSLNGKTISGKIIIGK